jgi:site-specific recombinase XerD
MLALRSGPIFGRHDYRVYLREAGLDDELRTQLAAYDFRHARGTHLVDRGAALSGVAYQLGHTQVSTTSKYAHATKRAGDAALAVGGADLTGALPDQEKRK